MIRRPLQVLVSTSKIFFDFWDQSDIYSPNQLFGLDQIWNKPYKLFKSTRNRWREFGIQPADISEDLLLLNSDYFQERYAMLVKKIFESPAYRTHPEGDFTDDLKEKLRTVELENIAKALKDAWDDKKNGD